MSEHEDYAEPQTNIDDSEADLQRQIDALEAEAEQLSKETEGVGDNGEDASAAQTGPRSQYDPQAQAEADSRSVYVGNVDYAATEADLRSLFESCGEILRVTIPSDRDGRSKGYAYVEFANPDIAGTAMLLTDRELNGRVIQVTSKRTNTAGVSRGRGGRGGFQSGRGGRGGHQGGPRGGFQGGSYQGGRGMPPPQYGYAPPGYGYPPPPGYGGGYYPPPQYGYPPPPPQQQGGGFRGGRGGARGGRGGRQQQQ